MKEFFKPGDDIRWTIPPSYYELCRKIAAKTDQIMWQEVADFYFGTFKDKNLSVDDMVKYAIKIIEKRIG